MEYLGRDMERDLKQISQPERSGTIFIAPMFMVRGTFWDKPALWKAAPVRRFGNIFVYQGTFHLPAFAAGGLYWHGIEKTYSDKPDETEAEKVFHQSVQMDPSAFFVHIELGNLLLKRGAREEALQAYSDALKYSPDDPTIRQPIEEQIRRFSYTAEEKIPPLRNPFLE